MTQPLATWVDGEQRASLPATDRGLQYGDGLFETIVCRTGKLRFLALHRERLQQGLDRLRIPFDAHAAGLTADLERARQLASAAAPAGAIVKLVVTRGDSQARGYQVTGQESARRIVTVWPDTPLPDSTRTAGVAVRFGQLRLGENPALAGLKHLNRLELVLARMEWQDAGIFDALLADGNGDVVSGTMSNVFALQGQTLLTPPVDRCGIAGVMRAVVLREAAAALGLTVSVARMSRAALLAADSIFLTNARIGILPVREVAQHRFAIMPAVVDLMRQVERLDA